MIIKLVYVDEVLNSENGVPKGGQIKSFIINLKKNNKQEAKIVTKAGKIMRFLGLFKR